MDRLLSPDIPHLSFSLLSALSPLVSGPTVLTVLVSMMLKCRSGIPVSKLYVRFRERTNSLALGYMTFEIPSVGIGVLLYNIQYEYRF